MSVKAINNTDKTEFNPVMARADFPILTRTINGKPLVYLDNAASTQKPQVVIDRLVDFYTQEYANIHRGNHTLSQLATNAYESTREKIKNFINARYTEEIIFVRGTTEGINLIASSFAEKYLTPGDEIIISAMEHHSNIVPWQMICQRYECHLKVIPMNQQGELLLDEYEKLLTPRTKLVAVAHTSNALGTINPVEQIIQMAHKNGSYVLIDGAQGIPHSVIDVQKMDCDFFAFSGHKLYGPTGIGAIYGKKELLEAMPPYQGGGDMIEKVTFAKTTYNELPHKFEAGTPNIADTVALGTAIDYVSQFDWLEVIQYEDKLLTYATDKLLGIDGLSIIGTAKHKTAVLSFAVEGVHPNDIGTLLDQEAVAIRTGHHCAQPVMDFYKVPATARASLALYNNQDDIDIFVSSLNKVLGFLR